MTTINLHDLEDLGVCDGWLHLFRYLFRDEDVPVTSENLAHMLAYLRSGDPDSILDPIDDGVIEPVELVNWLNDLSGFYQVGFLKPGWDTDPEVLDELVAMLEALVRWHLTEV